MFKKNKNILPFILIILDGWGITKNVKGNAVALANTPTMDGLIKKYPNTLLNASGEYVGLPLGQPGNSEAGHMNIGAGRIVEQDELRISRSILDGTFFKNVAFLELVRHIKKNKSRLHIMGMISNGMSPHSNPEHLIALLKFAKNNGLTNPILHLFTDGRDSPPYSSLQLIHELKNVFSNGEQFGTVIGRFYAMDRKKEWNRTELAYNALVLGEGRTAHSIHSAITESYNKGENDEYIEPSIIVRDGKIVPRIKDNDGVIFFNLRSDRGRQLTKVFVQKDFYKKNPGSFKRKKFLRNLKFVAMTDFGPDLDNVLTAFPSVDLKSTLPMCLSKWHQLYLAETEKYAHVTYFFNGGYAGKVSNEDQFMIDSPRVKSYNETPSMSSRKLTDKILDDLSKKRYDITIVNFAAPDMIGHTGDLKAGIKCCSAIDRNLAKIVAAYTQVKGTIIITADHGNIEEMINLKTGEIDTEHSTNPVPFILINKNLKNFLKLRNNGNLSDIAPTILDLLGVSKPKEMTGRSLIK